MTLAERIAQVADALRPLADEIDDLQVYGFWNAEPSPPCLDVFPGSPFADGASLRDGDNLWQLTVRARVGMADTEAAQRLLIRLLDTGDAASVEKALAKIDVAVMPEGVSGYTQYADDANANERMLGCEWRVGTFLDDGGGP